MRSVKALVLEKSGSHYTVLGNDGTFRKVRLKVKAQVGEEIDIREGFDFGSLKTWATVAAVMLLMISAALGWNLYQAPTAVALLSVDINPSLELELDAQGKVMKPIPKNEDAKVLLSGLDLKGKPAEEVLQRIIEKSISLNYLTPELSWVVLGYSQLQEEAPSIDVQNLTIAVERIEKEKGLTPQVTVFKVSSDDLNIAAKEGLTIGQYGLWKAAEKSGVKVDKNSLKYKTERNKILEEPDVKEKLWQGTKSKENVKSNQPSGKKEEPGKPIHIQGPLPKGEFRDQDKDDKKVNSSETKLLEKKNQGQPKTDDDKEKVWPVLSDLKPDKKNENNDKNEKKEKDREEKSERSKNSFSGSKDSEEKD
ncbi:MAG: anti-sigma factor domain-containing protein [Desulfitobacterium hafniense]|nr:anti-sigma factor domain-containing protein [Desulfitobacterium hafniense]